MLLSYLSSLGVVYFIQQKCHCQTEYVTYSGNLSTGRLEREYLQFEASLSCMAGSILKMPQIQNPISPKRIQCCQ